MKYHLDTIPVWDAVKKDGECPLCALERRTELGEAERYLGASVMEPDIRVTVNRSGFCTDHHRMLFSMSNRLGHALMLESHTIETRERMSRVFAELITTGKALSEAGLGDRISGKTKTASETVSRQAKAVCDVVSSCVMCDSIQENMQRYLHTFFHLYKNDSEFRSRIKNSKGFCLKHFASLLETAPAELSPRELGNFISEMADLEEKNLERIQEDISWFIKKFDYRYDREDWKNSRDAVERTVNKLRGWCIGKEPND